MEYLANVISADRASLTCQTQTSDLAACRRANTVYALLVLCFAPGIGSLLSRLARNAQLLDLQSCLPVVLLLYVSNSTDLQLCSVLIKPQH